MSVITIRGNMGSGAPEIGKLVAGKLHFDYVDREIIDKVAELLQGEKHDIEMKEMPPGSLKQPNWRSFETGLSDHTQGRVAAAMGI